MTKDRYAEKEKDGGKNGNGVKESKNEEKGKVQRERKCLNMNGKY